jgi:hypothetical protein
MLLKLFTLLVLVSFCVKADEANNYQKFFSAHCFDCHNDKKQKGKVRLDNISLKINTVEQADHWQAILDAVQSGEMPPEEEPVPPASEKLAFLDLLSAKLVEARTNLSDSGGQVIMRRLNRNEYANTLESILGVTVDVNDLPDDRSGESFDTDGGSLFMSPDQLGQYLRIARGAIEKAFNRSQNQAVIKHRVKVESKNAFIRKQRDKLLNEYKSVQAFRERQDKNAKPSDFGLKDLRATEIISNDYKRFFPTFETYLNHPLSKEGYLLSLFRPIPQLGIDLKRTVQQKNNAKKFKTIWAAEGLYKVRMRVAKTANADPERCFLNLGIMSNGSLKPLQSFHVTADAKEGQILEAIIEVKDGSRRLVLSEKSNEGTARAKFNMSRKSKTKAYAGPGHVLWVDWVEWEGPLKYQPTSQIKEVLKTAKASLNKAELRSLMKNFALEAFRGEVAADDFIDKLMAIYEKEKSLGKDSRQAIVEPLAVILSSPSFLYLSEASVDNKKTILKQSELANRLAYFLWSSPPDKELLQLVQSNDFRGEQVSKQVDRMLADPKTKDFYQAFAYQWLDMERLYLFQFDAQKYPNYDETLRDAAAEEVYETLKYIVDHKLSTRNLIKSDFVVLNAMLATHYGIKGVVGDEFRKVDLSSDSMRGGLMGMAAIAAMGSDGQHTSPVERGVWVLRKLLNNPPPPAPANVPQLSRLEGQALTVREVLKVHQEEPQCSHCHKKIDPIGLGLENFDATGRWRWRDNLNKIKVDINPSGSLYKGPSFESYAELREIIYERADDFNYGLIKSLLTYSLGRSVAFSDRTLMDKLHLEMKRNKFTMHSLIHAIVQSEEFQTKK